VMTFNIRYDNPGDGENAWPHRKDEVARLIERHADIAGLQEALPGQIEDLEKSLPQFDWYGVGRDDGDRQGEFCPVFYRRDRFELLERKSWWLSETPDVPGSKSWDAAITRLVTQVRLRDRQRGGEINILNTHFDHIGAAAREASARLIRQGVAGLDADTPLVVMGDLNCTPDQTPYQILTRADVGDDSAPLADTLTLSRQEPEGPDSTWNAFRAVEPGRRIDFILVGPGVEVAGHRTLTDRINGRFPSDHLPVVADLIFTAWHATP
jgi:endonuclease/exonuclease/phosphatase family metal-dependent hydrolase